MSFINDLGDALSGSTTQKTQTVNVLPPTPVNHTAMYIAIGVVAVAVLGGAIYLITKTK